MNTTETATRSVVVERTFPHPPEKVWRALTQGALIEEWLLKNDFEPVLGHRFKLRNEPMPQWDGVIDCEVLAIEPHRRLAYSWNALGLESTVTFTLTPEQGGTLLRMEQAGFPQGRDNDRYVQGANYGWQRFLGNLEHVLAKLS
jgi:uncharacterized protein YndB with AHSA1/START domain